MTNKPKSFFSFIKEEEDNTEDMHKFIAKGFGIDPTDRRLNQLKDIQDPKQYAGLLYKLFPDHLDQYHRNQSKQ